MDGVLARCQKSAKPLAVILAGHNGSGKSTLWCKHLSDIFQIPLINADRIMLSILPEPDAKQRLSDWATDLRDKNPEWMWIAQKGVGSFVDHALKAKVPFAVETVFSHWKEHADGRVESKIDWIKKYQRSGYFVLLLFVGLTSVEMSIARVKTRKELGGHGVALGKLRERFPRTQKAVRHALLVADAALLIDNSFSMDTPFPLCRAQFGDEIVYDCRDAASPPPAIINWMKCVCPK